MLPIEHTLKIDMIKWISRLGAQTAHVTAGFIRISILCWISAYSGVQEALRLNLKLNCRIEKYIMY